ncbi:MAG TPA: S24 family peptidase [Rhizomicrobium sp.]|jgi:phage repressor protein C with HTH and peptisase S24 domain|nr:S24 family peptidase [Rhizomicrobium sp.]
MDTLAKRLAEAMSRARLNQPGLARQASTPDQPVTQQTVHNLVSGQTTHSKHLPALADALGVSLEWLTRGDHTLKAGAGAASVAGGEAHLAPIRGAHPSQLRVLGMAECGPDGWSMWNGDVIDTVPTPSGLQGAPNAYAVYAVGTSMEPRYYEGELVFVHPGKPVTAGSFVLVQIRPEHEGDTPKAVVKRLIKRTASKTVLEQFNPARKFDVRNDDIVSIHRVVGSGES